MAGIGPAFFDRLPRSPDQQGGPPPLDQGGVPVSPGFDQLPRSSGQQERPPLLGQRAVPAFPASGFTSRHKYLPFGAPPIPGRSPLSTPSSNNPPASQPTRTQSLPGRTCPSIGLLGGPSPGGVLPPGSSLPMPSSSLLPNPRQVQAGLGQAPSSVGYLGNTSLSGLLSHGAPPSSPHKPWDCDPPLPHNSPLRGKFDCGPPLPGNSPLRQLWGRRLSVQTPPRAQYARVGAGPAPLSATCQPTSLQPVMLPCVTSSLPLSQTAAASKAAPQELVKSSRNGDDALVRGPVLYDLEPKYRRGPAIPIGKGIELNGQRLEPTQGEQGYGIYAPSSEENVIDFYPVNGGGLPSQKAPFQAPHGDPPPLEAPAKEPAQPGFIPFDWEPPNSGPDLVDPKFREVLAQVMSIVPPNVDTELKKARLFQETVGPMATYIRNIPGKQGRELHDMLIKKCKELGIGRGLDCMRPSGLEE